MSQEITKEQIAAFDADFSAQRANRVAMNAVTNNGLLASAIRREAVEQDVHEYSISLEQGEICNQKQSGRCWMFAALNTLRYQVMKKYDLKTFELSQAYLFFWDKLEKSNYFLESILDTLDEPANGRLVSYLLTAPVNDGGQWDMLCNLIEKYGVVPKTAYPESCASCTRRARAWTSCAPARPGCWARSTACSASAWASLPRPLPLSTAIRTTTSTVKRA